MTKSIWIVVLLIVLAFPVSNLIGDNAKQDELKVKANASNEYKEFTEVLKQNCIDCHSSKTKMPFYAKLPIAKDLIGKDIREGIEHFDMEQEIFARKTMTEATLAKLEAVVLNGSMPPLRYIVMHWDTALGQKDKDAILNYVRSLRAGIYGSPFASQEFRGEPVQPLPDKFIYSERKAELGAKLFHDNRLSANDSVSCAYCHGLESGGVDRLQFSLGIDDQQGHINAPTVYNAALNFKQFWDGRAETLEDQARGPVANPIEMGATWKDVVAKLKKEPEYVRAFRKIYHQSLNEDNIVNAIAEFERSLSTPNSAFDRYLKGEKGTLSKKALKGYELFKKNGCASCHYGIALGGQSFKKMGEEKDYFKDRGGISPEDLGRYNVTKDESDKFKFKVPTLRNIAVTQPYFHDGSVKELKDAVKIMSKYQLGKNLSDGDAVLIVEFLKSLTGEYKGKLLE